MSEHNYRVDVEQHCDGCKCQPIARPNAPEIVRAMTESLARDEAQHRTT